MKKMKIIVLGAGAIGSLYGAKLSKLNDVTLVARKEHAEKINKSGLKVRGIENATYRLKAATKVGKIDKGTLVLLTTKVTDSEKAVKGIKNLLEKDTIIMCLQNGLYSENIVKEVIRGKCTVIRAVTNFGAAFLEPGIIKYNSHSYTAIEKSSKSEEIAGNFRLCGLNGYVSENIRHDMWKKLILNCVLNPISAVLKVENRAVADKRLDPVKSLIAEECAKVAEKDGIKLDIDFVREINQALKGSRNISSMQQDLMKGRKTEIGHMNGAVAALGKRYGINCPANEALASIISDMEKNTNV